MSNCFSTLNGDLVENVLTFLYPGYSQNIVIDTYGEEEEEISHVMKIVMKINMNANIARTTGSVLSTGQCKDILTKSTYTSEYEE